MEEISISKTKPFLNRSADTDSISEIIRYWCEPNHIELNGLLTDEKSIFIVGPRGCGKTTLFKYYSYQSQIKLGYDIDYFINNNLHICIYQRLGETNFDSFSGKGLESEFWMNLITHYFELKLSLLLLLMVEDYTEINIKNKGFQDLIFTELIKKEGFQECKCYSDIVSKINENLLIVNQFVRMRSMVDVTFDSIIYNHFELLSIIVQSININFRNSKALRVAFFLDEAENVSKSVKKVLNTYVKFVPKYITFRLGSRPNGINTYETLAHEEIRLSHDFSEIKINNFMKINAYKEFLKNVANKRLEVSCFARDMKVKIEDILGLKEDILKEVSDSISADFDNHFSLLKSNLDSIDLIKIRDEDKLKELLNIIKLNRGENINQISYEMHAFNNKLKNTNEYNKYKNSYTNKYKKSLAFLILELANKSKKYYSLDTFAYLSSGSTRIFLKLCHEAFSLAEFYTPNVLYENKMINMEYQTKAALIVSEEELNVVKKSHPYGNETYNLIDNLCRLFKEYQYDKELKYPETNQFTLSDRINDTHKDIIDFALRQSYILQKENLQQRSIGQPKTLIYTLNRIYFPSYKISVVTRGGFNPILTEDIFDNLIKDQIESSKIKSIFKSKLKDKKSSTCNQITLELEN